MFKKKYSSDLEPMWHDFDPTSRTLVTFSYVDEGSKKSNHRRFDAHVFQLRNDGMKLVKKIDLRQMSLSMYSYKGTQFHWSPDRSYLLLQKWNPGPQYTQTIKIAVLPIQKEDRPIVESVESVESQGACRISWEKNGVEINSKFITLK